MSPVFEAYRYIAPLAWVPFAALWFGTGIGGPMMVIFTGAFAPCVLNAYRGANIWWSGTWWRQRARSVPAAYV